MQALGKPLDSEIECYS